MFRRGPVGDRRLGAQVQKEHFQFDDGAVLRALLRIAIRQLMGQGHHRTVTMITEIVSLRMEMPLGILAIIGVTLEGLAGQVRKLMGEGNQPVVETAEKIQGNQQLGQQGASLRQRRMELVGMCFHGHSFD